MSNFIKRFLNEIESNVVEIIDPSKYKFAWHEVSSTEPPMSREDFSALKNSMSLVGQLKPVIVYKELLVDGRHRQRGCIELTMPLKVVKLKGDYSTSELRETVRNLHMNRDKTAVQKQIQAYKYKQLVSNVTWVKASEKYGVKERSVKRINELYNLLTINNCNDFDFILETLLMGLTVLPKNFHWLSKPTSSFSSLIKQFKDYSNNLAIEEKSEMIDSTEKKMLVDNTTGEIIYQDLKKEDNPLNGIIQLKDELEKLKSENEILREKLKKYEGTNNE